MPTVTVNIQPTIVRWVLTQTPEDKIESKLVENIKQWLDGTKKPTFRQIEEFSKKSNDSIGVLFLAETPSRNAPII